MDTLDCGLSMIVHNKLDFIVAGNRTDWDTGQLEQVECSI